MKKLLAILSFAVCFPILAQSQQNPQPGDAPGPGANDGTANDRTFQLGEVTISGISGKDSSST